MNRLVERVNGLSQGDADRLEWARRLALVVQQNEAAHTLAGMRFSAALGKKYLAIATAYGGPSMDKGTAPEDGSVDAALEKVATGPFLLSLHPGAVPSTVASWLSEERPMRFQVEHLRVPLGPAFDVVAFFDRATRAVRATTPR